MLLFLLIAHFGIVLSNGPKTEFCQWEEYEASCPENEVIVMTSAKYGRMKLGRCVDRDFGYLGCGTNVLPQLDRQCSGKSQCQFQVTTLHDGQHLCPKDLTAYLDVQHMCLQVTPCQKTMCSSSDYLKLSSPTGYLASAVTASQWCGSSSCPWMLTGKAGQTFNLTLVDFTYSEDERRKLSSGVHDICHRYATITEDMMTKDITSCTRNNARERHIYTSTTNTVQVQLYTEGQQDDGPLRYLIKYEALGCPDMDPPKFGKVSRKGNALTVQCINSQKVWHLTCKKTTWIGEIGQCEGIEEPKQEAQGILANARSSPYGMLIVIGLGVALGVVIGSLMLFIALVCMKRTNKRRADQIMKQHSLLRDASPSREHFVIKSENGQEFYHSGYPTLDHNYTSTLHPQHQLGMRPLPPAQKDSNQMQGQQMTASEDSKTTTVGPGHVYEMPQFGANDTMTLGRRDTRAQSVDKLSGHVSLERGNLTN